MILFISLERWITENFNLKSKSYWPSEWECTLIGDFRPNLFNVFRCWYFISTTCFRPHDVSFNILIYDWCSSAMSKWAVSTCRIAKTFQFTVEREKKCGKRPSDTWINKQYLGIMKHIPHPMDARFYLLPLTIVHTT